MFWALGDETRLRMLEFIASGDPACCAGGEGVCNCDLQVETSLSQPTVSHHLKILAEAGLVRLERRGKWTYCRLNPEGFALARGAAERLLALSPALLELS